MSRVEVLGRDVAREAYHIRTEDGAAFVPECLMDGLRPGARPSHQEAYEWIAAHRGALSSAVAALVRGNYPKPPYDLVTLASEEP
ncbi:hypothetical protein FIU97_04575 [Roseivivax sp. THAF40]|uniref:hypothetical protein n=1 Tax=unclassified Roseivivax TaxID=2639302 RepID=UPI001268ACC7|nr:MULTISPECIES: hypothetical protein [unclassified Roseivivax]QFS82045.1 hypothetical protein FIV09_04315 [Roseivivax sp. THAF197b]QFT45845.1 hypothetical protein FIU97_04575 [Roseivivax sp. THAF40]